MDRSRNSQVTISSESAGHLRGGEWRRYARAMRVVAVAVMAFALAGCSGHSAATSSRSTSTTSVVTTAASGPSTTPVYSRTNGAKPPVPVYISAYRAGGHLSGHSTIRAVQGAALRVGLGQHRRLLALRGIGALTMTCAQDPTSRFDLTTWAKGEGPPVVQHAQTHPGTPMALVPFTQAGGPITLPHHGPAQTFETWQITIITSAFDANATILTLTTRTQHGCDLSAAATVISHGQFYRYAH
jgi:hypothetical protein